jgi:hypothetical protein
MVRSTAEWLRVAVVCRSKPRFDGYPRERTSPGRSGLVLNMDVTSGVLLVIGVFVAVTGLVRLMRRRRDQLLAELTAQAREEQHRKKLAELLEKKKQKRRAA